MGFLQSVFFFITFTFLFFSLAFSVWCFIVLFVISRVRTFHKKPSIFLQYSNFDIIRHYRQIPCRKRFTFLGVWKLVGNFLKIVQNTRKMFKQYVTLQLVSDQNKSKKIQELFVFDHFLYPEGQLFNLKL